MELQPFAVPDSDTNPVASVFGDISTKDAFKQVELETIHEDEGGFEEVPKNFSMVEEAAMLQVSLKNRAGTLLDKRLVDKNKRSED